VALPVRRLLLGKPIDTRDADHQKLPKIIALPVFASDALSSVAYATEEIMNALLVTGTGFFFLTTWFSVGIVVLLTIVSASYRQTIMAYPTGGGAYIVAHENLGDLPAMTAGAALLVDYVLTVSVSVASGVANFASMLGSWGHPMTQTVLVWTCVGCVAFIAFLNLRGLKESGAVFAIPTYSFVFMMYVIIGLGMYRMFLGGGIPMLHTAAEMKEAGVVHGNTFINGDNLGLFLILHAFASGCTALTGVEAISNGVPAFKSPASKNASTTMTWMATILGSVFIGLSYIATKVNALPGSAVLIGKTQAEAMAAKGGDPSIGETVISQLGRAVFDVAHSHTGNLLYGFTQIATALILILAANTSFADFPRLSALMAKDGFLPRQFSNIGDKLVFDRGIVVLTVFATILIVAFGGSVDALIPLYAIGVFLSFTLSQAGMVRHWFALKDEGWQHRAWVNGFGACCTAVVTVVFGMVKFRDGAWLVIIMIPSLVMLFSKIKAHYRSVAKQLSLEGYRPKQGSRHHVFVLVPDIHRGVIPAMQYGRTISSEAKALHVSIDPAREKRLRDRWTLYSRGMPLVMLPSPYRSLVQPIIDHITEVQLQDPGCLVTVVIPEFEPSGWFGKMLHGHAAFSLALRLHFMPGVVVANVPYHIAAFVQLEKGNTGPSNPGGHGQVQPGDHDHGQNLNHDHAHAHAGH